MRPRPVVGEATVPTAVRRLLDKFDYPARESDSQIVPILSTLTADAQVPTSLGWPSITDPGYTAWPFGALWVDAASSLICQVYTHGTSHVSADKIVHFRSRSLTGVVWGSAVTVGDLTGLSLGGTCHAAGIADNGDYLAIVRYTDVSEVIDRTLIHVSSDQGATWDAGTQLQTTGPVDYDPEEPGSLFLTSAGTLLSYTRDSADDSFIIRNTTVGGTGAWAKIALTGEGSDTPAEGSFAELGDGTILCVVRRNIGSVPYDTSETAMFTTSSDDGATWAALAATDIASMTNNPAAVLYLSASDEVEVLAGDRFAHPEDGLPSIWRYRTSAADAKTGAFGGPIQRLIGTTALVGPNFGYPAAVINDEQVLVTWYDGTPTRTIIYEYLYPVGEVISGDHGELGGLADDDHPQYLNEARHDALDHAGLTGVTGELLMQDGVTAPPVPIETEAQDDWLYVD